MFRARKKKLGYVIAYKLGKSKNVDIVFTSDQLRQTAPDTYVVTDLRGNETILHTGDYVILDRDMFLPIPVLAEDFKYNYVYLVDNIYDEVPREVSVWSITQAMTDEIKFIRDIKGVTFTGFMFVHRYAKNGLQIVETAPGDSYVVIDHVYYDTAGNVIDVDFQFVDSKLFHELYTVI